MLSAVLAILLSQTPATEAEVTGALNTMDTAIREARAGSRNVTATGNGRRACIRPATSLPNGTVTVRFGASLIASSFQEFLGLSIPSHIPSAAIEPVFAGTWLNPETGLIEPYQTGTTTRALGNAERWALTPDQYAVFEVQALPSEVISYDRSTWRTNVDVLSAEAHVVPSATWPVCEFAMFRVDDASIKDVVRCACWDGQRPCQWQRPNDDGTFTQVACPTGLTMSPGSFSGAGAEGKSCVARFDGNGIDGSWPAACPK